MSNDGLMRVFLALESPEEIVRELGVIQNRLRRACPFDIRWVKPEAMHVTLKFFGNVSGKDVLTISRLAELRTAGMEPLRLEVKGLGLFPSRKRPHVFWIGLTGATVPLVTLQKDLERDCAGCGFAQEERPFRPHLTLGRIKSPRCSGDPDSFMQEHADIDAGDFQACGLCLFRSDLTPQGAVYTRLGWFPFGGARDEKLVN